MCLIALYNEVNEKLSNINFDSLFQGFKKYNFALYNSKEVCLNGEIIPYNEKFLGNTSILYNDEIIAIWNVELDNVEDIEILAYCLVHEMFHCFQKEKGLDKYPNDFVIFNYPKKYEIFNLKYNENIYLVNALENRDSNEFNKFVLLRNKRLLENKEYVIEELLTEQLEGIAEYVGLKALKYLNKEKYDKKINDYISLLTKKSNLLFDVRRICYYSGAIFWLCLDNFNISFSNIFSLDNTVFESLEYKDEQVNVIENYDIKDLLIKSLNYKKKNIDDFISHSKYYECDGKICGYDPMNTYRYNDYLYCKYFIFLNENDNSYPIYDEVVLLLKENSLNEIKGYYKR